MTPSSGRKSSGGPASSSTPGQEDFPSDGYPYALAGDDVGPPEDVPADLVEAWRAHELAEREEAGDLYAAGSWRPAPAIARLFQEANAANPNRDKRSDGIVGDLRHQARVSGHNPDARGVVVAGDLDADLRGPLSMAEVVERARQLARLGKLPQLRYVIYAARITRPDFAGWAEYDGDNPHVTHAHFETDHDPKKADDARPWNLWAVAGPTTPRPAPTTPRDAPRGPTAADDLRGRGYDLRGEQGAEGPRVAALQVWLRRRYPLYARQLEPLDDTWGPKVTRTLREFARRSGVRTADGRNIGPKIARALYAAGFRG